MKIKWFNLKFKLNNIRAWCFQSDASEFKYYFKTEFVIKLFK